MAERSEWRLLAALLALAAALVVLVSPDGGRSALDPRASSFRATPAGVMALYLLLEEMEITVDRRLTPLVGAEPLPAALALLAPSEPLSPAEVTALLAWVEEGGRLLYAAAPGDTLLTELGLHLQRVRGDSGAVRASVPASAAEQPLTAGVERAHAFDVVFADSSPALSAVARPLLTMEDGGVGAVILPRGEGTILAWSDADPFSNQSLRSGETALLLVRALRTLVPAEGVMQFDEYHHGFRGGGSPAAALLSFLRDTRAGRMSLQLLLVGAGVLLLLGRRFGAAIPPAAARRRSPLEHLHALAAAYREGNARSRARQLIVAGAARRLGRAPPLPGQEEAFIMRLATPAAHGREAAQALAAQWSKGTDADLVELARRADSLIAETTHR